MKKLVLASAALTLLALVGVLWLGAPVGASVETTIETAAPTAASTPEPTAPGSCEAADPLALPGTEQACCIDQCSRDRDCRFICGKEFGGQCIQVNSCCRECACFGFAPSTGLPS